LTSGDKNIFYTTVRGVVCPWAIFRGKYFRGVARKEGVQGRGPLNFLATPMKYFTLKFFEVRIYKKYILTPLSLLSQIVYASKFLLLSLSSRPSERAFITLK